MSKNDRQSFQKGFTCTKRGKGYLFRVSTGKQNPDGSYKYASMTYYPEAKTEAKIKQELEKVGGEFRDKVRSSETLDASKINFSDFVETWKKEYADRKLKLRMAEFYLDNLNRFVIPEIGNKPLSKIKKMDCQRVLNNMADNDYSLATIKHAKSSMQSVFKFASSMDIIEKNPFADKDILLPKAKKKSEATILSLDQTREFLDCLTWNYPVSYGKRKRIDSNGDEYTVEGYQTTKTIPFQFVTLFNVLIFSGFRREEVIALQWQDVDFSENALSVNKAIIRTRANGQEVGETKTESSNRTIYMPSHVMQLLRDWKEQQMDLCLSLANKWQGESINSFEKQWVFIQSIGKRMDLWTPYQRLQRILDDHNKVIERQAEEEQDPEVKKQILSRLLPHLRLHDLRHLSASQLIAEGADVASVSARLGHGDVSTTMRIYVHGLEEKDKQNCTLLERLYEGDKPMIHMETIKVSNDEKKVLERLRTADKELQELFMDMLNGNYSKQEMYSLANQNTVRRS